MNFCILKWVAKLEVGGCLQQHHYSPAVSVMIQVTVGLLGNHNTHKKRYNIVHQDKSV